MVCNTQSYYGSGLCASSDIKKEIDNSVSVTDLFPSSSGPVLEISSF
jgi:hypothetical protein